jgi:hypothetical protein
MPETAKKAVAWLKTRRVNDVQGLCSLGMLPRLPALERLLRQKGGTDEDLEWSKRLIGEYLNNAYTDCIVYTYATAPDYITAFKLRPAGPDKSAVRFIEASRGGDIGAFGVLTPAFYAHYGSETVTRFMAVEGEHDQLALYMDQVVGGAPTEVVIGLGGDGHRGVSFMRSLGFTSCRLIGDDDAAGSVYPTKVLPKTQGISFEIFQWPGGVRDPLGGKMDPDEAVRRFGFDAVFTAVLAPGNYVYALQWALQLAAARVKTINPDNVSALKDVAEEIAGYLTDETERFTFAQKYEELCPGIPAQEVIRATLAASDTPLGFAARIRDWFLKTYQVTTWNDRENELTLWHYQKRRTITAIIDSGVTIPRLLRDFTEGSVYYWAKAEVGLPGYIPNPDAHDATESTMRKVEIPIEQAIHRALRQLVPMALEDASGLKGQGIHLVKAEREGIGHIVNGRRLFRVVWDEARDKITEVTELNGPVDGPDMFDLGRKTALVPDMEKGWTTLFTKPDDLKAEPPLSLRDTFTMTHNLIDMAFGFEQQEPDAMYGAVLVFYNYLHDVFVGRRVLTHLSAHASSGKTSFLSITSNHMQYRDYSLCDHAHPLDVFTQAGFFQVFSNTRLVAVLDEMNDPDDKSPESIRKKEFYIKCRSLATSGFASVSQGTQDGYGRQYSLYTSIITAAGTVIGNQMDESRFNTINLIRDNKRNVRAVLQTLYTPEEYQRLRQSIFLHSLRIAPKVAQEYRALYARYIHKFNNEAPGTTNGVDLTRATENIMPLASILNVIGEDGEKFIDSFRESRKKKTTEQAINTAGHNLIDLVLSHPLSARDSDENYTTIKAMLLNPTQRDRINDKKCGVYYDDKTKCLVFSWAEMRAHFGSFLRKPVPALIFEMRTAKEWIVTADQARATGLFDRLAAFGLTHVPEVVSVITVKAQILDRVERAVAAREERAAVEPPTGAAPTAAPPPEPAPSVPDDDFLPGV